MWRYDFFVPDQPTSENEVYYCNIHGVYYPHPGGFQFTYIPNRSVENMYCLGLPDRTKDCTTAFWGNEEMRRTPAKLPIMASWGRGGGAAAMHAPCLLAAAAV
eukprot:SAG25_NODE_2005_length_2037_cov_3.046956_3_plen_103_part_00